MKTKKIKILPEDKTFLKIVEDENGIEITSHTYNNYLFAQIEFLKWQTIIQNMMKEIKHETSNI